MGLEADAVAESVGEGFAMAGGFYNFAGNAVEVVISGAGTGGIDGGLAGGIDDLMDLDHFGGGFAKADHAGHVGGVALVENAVVDEEEVSGAGDCLVGKVMNLPATGTTSDDGSEGVAFNFFAPGHLGEEESLDAALGHAGLDLRKDGVEDLLVDLLRFLHEGNLGIGFGLANGLDDWVWLDLMGGELFLPAGESGSGDTLVDGNFEGSGRQSIFEFLDGRMGGGEFEGILKG